MPVDQDRPADAGPDRRPWTPPCVPAELLEDPEALSYLVVDEIVGDTVTIAVSGWPGSDELGRVRFDAIAADAPSGHLLVHRKELHERLYEGWLRRTPRVGDAFAAVLGDAVAARLAESGEVVLDHALRLADALVGPVADLSAEARNIAKLAFYAAVAGVQPHEQAEALGQVPKAPSSTAPQPGAVKPGRWTGPVLSGGDGGAVDWPRWTVPKKNWPAGGETDLVTAVRANPTALFYFLLNIGDGDSQLLLMPEERDPAHPDAPIP